MVETVTRGAVLTLLIVTLPDLGACTPEATAPQGAAAVARVVPVAVPDAWCAATPDTGQDSTSRGKGPARPACPSPSQPAVGNGSLKFVVDSALAVPDTTR